MGKYQAYPEYKDSGLQWLGEIPSTWQIIYSKAVFSERNEKAQLDDEQLTASQKYGILPQKLFMEMEQQKVVQVLKGHEILKKVEVDDFVISMRSFQGGIEYSPYAGSISSAYVPLFAKKNISKSFFKYFLKSAPYIQALQSTTNLVRDGQALRYGNFTQVPLPVFEFDEQENIGKFLDHETAKIDTLIEKQQQLIQLLKEKRQAVISHAVTKGLNPNAPMKDSGVEWLGEVPEGWKVTKFNYEIDLLEGPGILAVDFHEEGVPLLRIQNVKDDYVSNDFKTYLSPAKVKTKWDHFRVALGDLIISCSASTGLVSEVEQSTVGAIPYTGLIRLRPKSKSITKDFIRLLVQSDLFFEQINLLQSGSTIQHFGPYHLQQMFITLPSQAEQIEIFKYVSDNLERLDKVIFATNRQIELMQERRTALISAAVTGKIDVRSWQASEAKAQAVV